MITPKRALITASFLVSIAIALFEHASVPLSSQFYLDLTQYYGFISLALLYLVLLPGPFYRLFPNAPFSIAHRAYLSGLGISTFYFALLHSTVAFWGLLEGFAGIPYLPGPYFWAMIFGFLALLILAALAGTSFDYMRIKLGKNWKRLHRTVYAGAFLVVAHTAMAGSHFQSLGAFIPTFWMVIFFALVLMHAILLNRLLSAKYPQYSWLFFPVIIALVILFGLFILNFLHTYAHGAHQH
ncbi:MAG: hypothetical protein JO019_02445 [Candidatus Kaiserbacteria bacterium]|nr:hypothetical protein [Candidatus Kaiserbacteria bacterium]